MALRKSPITVMENLEAHALWQTSRMGVIITLKLVDSKNCQNKKKWRRYSKNNVQKDWENDFYNKVFRSAKDSRNLYN